MTSSTSIEVQKMYSGSVMIVEKSGKKVEIKTGSYDDIITYEDSGKLSKYSKVVVVAHWAYPALGTIIYK